MAAEPSVDPAGWLAEQVESASPDVLRSLLQAFVEALMSADVDLACGAGYGERSPRPGISRLSLPRSASRYQRR